MHKTLFREFDSDGDEKNKIKNKPVYLGLSILVISKTLMNEFWYDYIKQSTKTKQNYAIWIQTVLLFILELKIFMKTMLMMLKNGLTHQATVKMIKGCFDRRKQKNNIFFKIN